MAEEKENAETMENMGTIADLHIHSRFSRACSKNITIPNLVKYAKIKGLGLLGTGDFTHPLWLKEIKEMLVEKKEEGKNGLYYYEDFPFVLSGEISLMYSQDGKGRRVHLVVLAPNLGVVDKINSYLDTKGRRDYDGRPIFNISCEQFVSEMMKISYEIEVIPAHCMTPWFGIFGSKTGFDSLNQAFGTQLENVHSIETGMSADPEMLRKFSFLNNKSIVSFSDSHSFWTWRIGREATIFHKIESYHDLIKQIRENSFKATIETEPAYGRYHYSGHRVCNFSCSPEECKKINYICPVCKKPLTIGVEDRVQELGNQDSMMHNKKPYYKILPLHELIALAKASTLSSQKTGGVYNKLIEQFGNEFNILLNADKPELVRALPQDELLVQLIINNRIGNIKVKPGYDGEYGIALLPEKQEKLF